MAFIDLTSGNSTLQIDNLEETINLTLNDFVIINQNNVIKKVNLSNLLKLFDTVIFNSVKHNGEMVTYNGEIVIY